MKKLYIHDQDLRYGGVAWRAVAHRIGAVMAPTPGPDAVCFSLLDPTTERYAAEGRLPKQWMVMHDRVEMFAQGIPALPVVIPKTPADPILFSGPVFVKPRRTNIGVLPYAYKRFESADALRASVGDDFWAHQQNPGEGPGEYVVMPALDTPFQCLELCLSLNSSGELKTIFCNDVTHDTPKHLGNGVPVAMPEEVVALVKSVCERLSVRSTMLSIQLVQYEGKWVVMDWHYRPPASFSEGLIVKHPGACDSGLAHMLDGHVEDQPFYMEQRSYWKTGLPHSIRPLVLSLGFTPRAPQKGVFGCIAGAGSTKEEVQEKFNQIEEQLCLSVLLQP